MMTSKKIVIILIVLVVNFIPSVSADEKINIVCTLEAYASIAKFIGGEYVNVSYILPEGASPHEYSLTPEDIEKASHADLLIFVNSKFLSLEADLKNKLSSDKIFVDFEDYERYNLSILPAPGIDKNYHGYWLYPDNAIAIAKAIHNKLALLMPAHKTLFDENLNKFIEKITILKNKMLDVSTDNNFYQKGVLLAVPAAAYVAYAFEMNPRGLILKAPGSFASASEIDEIETQIKNGEIILSLCPESMRHTKPGEILLEIQKDTSIPIAYIRVFSLSGINDYFALLSYNIGAISSVGSYHVNNSESDDLFFLVLFGFIIFAMISIIETIIIFRFQKNIEGVLHE